MVYCLYNKIVELTEKIKAYTDQKDYHFLEQFFLEVQPT